MLFSTFLVTVLIMLNRTFLLNAVHKNPIGIVSALGILIVVGVLTWLGKRITVHNFWMGMIVIVFFSAVILSAIELLGNINLWHMFMRNPTAVLYGVHFVALMIGVGFSITGSVFIGVCLTTVVATLFGVVNYYMLYYRQRPLIPQDFISLKTLVNTIDDYQFSFTPTIFTGLLVLISVILVATRIKFVFKSKSLKIFLRSSVLLLLLLFPLDITTRWRQHGNPFLPNFFNQTISAKKNGMLMNYMGNVPNLKADRPTGYAISKINKAFTMSNPSESSKSMPNLIIVLGESWTNAIANNLTTNKVVTPRLNAITNGKNSRSGTLVVNGYGGGTAKTEFEIFTGTSSLNQINDAPYQSYRIDKIPNMIKNLHAMGYETTAIHTANKGNWGRDQAYAKMGFDHFIGPESLKTDHQNIRYYMSDQAIYKQALNKITATNKPQVIFCITMQTHGPYTDKDYKSRINVTKQRKQHLKAEQYLGLMNQTDQDIDQFLKQVNKLKEPTSVLLYGDHQPKVEKISANTNSTISKQISGYETFYKIYANYRLNKIKNLQATYLSTNYLGAFFLETSNVQLTEYQSKILKYAKKYPVINGRMVLNQKLDNVSQQKLRIKEFQLQLWLQYNLLFDHQHQLKKIHNI